MQLIDCKVRQGQTLRIEPLNDQRRAATDTCFVWYLAAVIISVRDVNNKTNIPPKSKHQVGNCNVFTDNSKGSSLKILVKVTEMANANDNEFTKTSNNKTFFLIEPFWTLKTCQKTLTLVPTRLCAAAFDENLCTHCGKYQSMGKSNTSLIAHYAAALSSSVYETLADWL